MDRRAGCRAARRARPRACRRVAREDLVVGDGSEARCVIGLAAPRWRSVRQSQVTRFHSCSSRLNRGTVTAGYIGSGLLGRWIATTLIECAAHAFRGGNRTHGAALIRRAEPNGCRPGEQNGSTYAATVRRTAEGHRCPRTRRWQEKVIATFCRRRCLDCQTASCVERSHARIAVA